MLASIIFTTRFAVDFSAPPEPPPSYEECMTTVPAAPAAPAAPAIKVATIIVQKVVKVLHKEVEEEVSSQRHCRGQ